MKRIISIILLMGVLFSLFAGCAYVHIVNIEREQVNAIVTKVSKTLSGNYFYIHVAYEGCVDYWCTEDKSLYDYFENRLGETIPCYLVTYTYDNDTTKQELFFNENLWEEKE
jgi:hypothetical protein